MSEHELILERINRLESMIQAQGETLKKFFMQASGKKWITVTEASEILDRHPNYLRNHKDEMKLIYAQTKRKGKILFSHESVLQCLERNSNRKYMKHD